MMRIAHHTTVVDATLDADGRLVPARTGADTVVARLEVEFQVSIWGVERGNWRVTSIGFLEPGASRTLKPPAAILMAWRDHLEADTDLMRDLGAITDADRFQARAVGRAHASFRPASDCPYRDRVLQVEYMAGRREGLGLAPLYRAPQTVIHATEGEAA